MKFRITLKDPDVLICSIEESLEYLKIDDVDDEELESIKEHRKEKILELCSKWFEYSEYLTVEVDTEKETCIVIENNENEN